MAFKRKVKKVYKTLFKKENLIIRNIKLQGESIIFDIEKKSIDKVKDLFDNDQSQINPYYPQFKTHQFNFNFKDSFNQKKIKFNLGFK